MTDIYQWILFAPANLVALSAHGVALVASAAIAIQMLIDWRVRGALLFEARFFRQPAVFVGLLWLIYVLYELQMSATPSPRSAAQTHRWDLLVLTPIMMSMSVIAVVSLYRQIAPHQAEAAKNSEEK